MAVTLEQRNRISSISVEEHGHIVDAFGTLGRDPETIAIRQGIDLEDIIYILKAYNLRLGNMWGDDENDKGINARVPERVVKEYVAAYYPGILEGTNPEVTMGKFIMGAIEKDG